LPFLAIAQEDEQSEPVDPLTQCLDIGRIRYERCTADADSDTVDCQDERENYEAQCYEVNQ
jgi:hypothetical protein